MTPLKCSDSQTNQTGERISRKFGAEREENYIGTTEWGRRDMRLEDETTKSLPIQDEWLDQWFAR